MTSLDRIGCPADSIISISRKRLPVATGHLKFFNLPTKGGQLLGLSLLEKGRKK
ncbi:hypothetical protein DPMN_116233 [Dreissena polymorpha]|uniref:Uncharacterized protein n=1 Tax=Dreissena polymorpha TaxID=45954 RepID=A0A9D4QTD3_DREPO|nr:hypothetical protein DPMN_116233 [Dreissena polymorpha]